MERVPKVSDSRRVGREAISGSLAVVAVGRAPGVKVEGAKICFMVVVDSDTDLKMLWLWTILID